MARARQTFTLFVMLSWLGLSGCALRPQIKVPASELRAFSEYSRQLLEAVEAHDRQAAEAVVTVWTQEHGALAVEGDLYASVLTEAALQPHPDAVYAVLAAAMIERFPAHPALWGAWATQLRLALDQQDPAVAADLWEHLAGAPERLQRELAASIAESLWSHGQARAAVEWGIRGAPDTSAALYWRLWAARVWGCCADASSDLEGLLGSVARFAGAVASGDAEQRLDAARALRRQDIRHGEPLRTIRELADRLLDGPVADVRDAGAVLPMSGVSSALGRSVLQIAAACMPDGRVNIRDTRSRVSGAAAALEGSRSWALLGPLRSAPLEHLGWTLLRRGQIVATPNPNPIVAYPVSAPIWSTALGPEEQARAIAAVLAEQGWKAVAVLHPDDLYGKRFMKVFWDAVLDHGGWFTGIGAYAPRSTDFGPVIRRLVGLDRYSPEEEREMKAQGEEPQPIIDFDALVVVGSPAELSLIPAQLAYYDVYDVRLIGDAGWRDPRIPQIAGKYMDGLLFIDVDLDPASAYPDCVTRAGMPPGPLPMAVVDAIAWLKATRDGGQPARTFHGVSGETRVAADHTVERRFQVWQWRHGKLSVWDGTDPEQLYATPAALPADVHSEEAPRDDE
ncbi:MAG: hypothetical protein D6761_05300 [Candidatus Dadabacteria bacterium]|nr:MAG: hypothetical protein D6761_05300 [Candidatus Dadabacteria bacterium]